VDAEPRSDFENRVAEILDQIRPGLQIDGGDVHLIAIEGKNVRLKLSGHYINGTYTATLIRMGIERTLHDQLPDIKSVILENTF